MAERDRRSDAGAADEGFLRRWSRRKAQARSAAVDPPAAAVEDSAPAGEISPEPRAQDAPPVDLKDLPDIDSLDAGSDFTPFMRPGVPAHLRTLALRKLWRSDPIFSHLDGLVEYGEDYTLASWPKGTIKTAYQIGRGFMDQIEKLEAADAPSAAPEEAVPPDPAAGPTRIAAPAEPSPPEPASPRDGAPEPGPAQPVRRRRRPTRG